MSLLERRLVVFADEWLGWFGLYCLRERGDWLFWPALGVFAVAMFVSYRALWRLDPP